MSTKRLSRRARIPRSCRLAAGSAVVSLLASAAVVLTATPASADERICGEPVRDTNTILHLEGPAAALSAESDNFYNSNLDRFLGDNRTACGIARKVIDIAAQRFVKIHLGSGTVWLKVAGEFNKQYGQMPSELPAVGGSGFSGIQAPVFGTGGVGVNVRSAPTTATALLAGIPEGATVTIKCTTTGQPVRGVYGVTSIWNRVTVNGVTGWISDAYTFTGQTHAAAPSC